MDQPLLIAVVAASSALLGAVIGAAATYLVESKRITAARVDADKERRIEAVLRFNYAARMWLTVVEVMPKTTSRLYMQRFEELEKAADELRHASVAVRLLCSDEVANWVRDEYNPAHQRMWRTAVASHQGKGSVDLSALKDEFQEILDAGLELCRAELARE